jgi:hypothetical protein
MQCIFTRDQHCNTCSTGRRPVLRLTSPHRATIAFALRDSAGLAFAPSVTADLSEFDGRQSEATEPVPRSARARPLPTDAQAGLGRIAAQPNNRADAPKADSAGRPACQCAFAFATLCMPPPCDILRHLTFELSGALPTAQPAVRCPLERGVGRQRCFGALTFEPQHSHPLD